MKKILLLTTMLFAFFSMLSAQITQEKADEIVQKRINSETKPYVLYAKEGVQTEMSITTDNGEILELDYSCWIYYVNNPSANCCVGRYLIVNESNGSLLEINPKNNAAPSDLTEWRIVEERCGCIMDRIKGEWTWIKIGGFIEIPFKSIIKILSQNEDASINYQVFVADTLFSEGSFQWQEYAFGYKISDMKIPIGVLPNGTIVSRNLWYLRFQPWQTGEESGENLVFHEFYAIDGTDYIYQKIRKE